MFLLRFIISFVLLCRWSEIIASNCVTMKHLPLSLEGPWQQINKSTKAFKRKYHTIKVDYSTNWNEDTMKVFRKHGTEVRCLEFNECEFQARQFKLFSRLLRTMTQLEVLKLNNCDIDYFKQKHLNKLKPVNLLHLKKVVLHESDETVSFLVSGEIKIGTLTLSYIFRSSSSLAHRS